MAKKNPPMPKLADIEVPEGFTRVEVTDPKDPISLVLSPDGSRLTTVYCGPGGQFPLGRNS